MKNKLIIALLLLALPLSAAELTLAWKDNSTNEAGFAIERSPGIGAPVWAEIARVGPNVITYKDTNLPNETAFSYRVRAFNAGGYSGYTAPATGTTVIGPPNAPSDATVTTVTVVVTVTTQPAIQGNIAAVSISSPIPN